MIAPKTRGAAIAAKCRDCIYDPSASGNWKEQVSVCSCIGCPLWRFRPIGRSVADWIKSRDPANLPEDWSTLEHDVAILRLHGNINANAERGAVHAPLCTNVADPLPAYRVGAYSLETLPESDGTPT